VNGNWVTGWGMAHCRVSRIAPKTAEKTVRTTVTGNVNGSKVRIRLSNTMGLQPLRVDSVYVRIGNREALRILFSEKPEITIDTGEEAISDPVDTRVMAGEEITVSMYYPGSVIPVSGNLTAVAIHSIKGNYSKDKSFETEKYKTLMSTFAPTEITEPMTTLAGVDIFTEERACVVAAFGDSITQMGNWVNPLKSHLYKEYPGNSALLNVGICGNRLLRDTGIKMFKEMYGHAGLKRMQWDVFHISGLTTVILELGTNDIFLPGSAGFMSPKLEERCNFEELIGGYRQVIGECRKRGIRVLGCTCIPCGLVKTFNEKTEELRRKANHWIMESGEFDHAFDIAAWVADPKDESYLNPEFDSGDHLHPNEKGGTLIASHIDPNLLL
jgi:Lysophospholipase L1 and related esterases